MALQRFSLLQLCARAGLAGLSLATLIPNGASAQPPQGRSETPADPSLGESQARLAEDRQSILAMAGDFDVTFDFRETVAIAPGYRLHEPHQSAGREVVRVIADTGRYISLQHILVSGGPSPVPIKHWRQDWRYEPESVLIYEGANAWRVRPLSAEERAGRWSQTVYQVDDSPRYGAMGRWSHEAGLSAWTGEPEWRPLPRREATTRDDYQEIIAVNRHLITPAGWVHEQDNGKLVVNGEGQRLLAREVGVNTYRRTSDFPVAVATSYWAATQDFWSVVRSAWSDLEAKGAFALTVRGEAEPLYRPVLGLADEVQKGARTADAAGQEARAVIGRFTTTPPGVLAGRQSGPAAASRPSAE